MTPLSQQELVLSRPLPASFDEMVADMLRCEQTAGQSVYQHGRSVCDHLRQLVLHLQGSISLLEGSWRLPTWFRDYHRQIAAHFHAESDWSLYALYHDCGKPYCCQIDEVGHRHFPNHAAVSQHVWLHVGGNELVGRLIAFDMHVHTATAEELSTLFKKDLSCEDSITLLLAALAEIHSNAKMFGGIDSVSFKMKLKTVERRGRQIVKHWFGDDPTAWQETNVVTASQEAGVSG